MIAMAMMAGACAPTPEDTRPTMTDAVADLPYAQGQSFTTLDAYLEHLRRLAPQDRPYFEEIAPGQYRRVSGRRVPGSPPADRTYTREELMLEFGFSE
tara:strand:+ start:19223 stop:19516 length:294 start_codon:yes stop_codon:yes gene_type:complete